MLVFGSNMRSSALWNMIWSTSGVSIVLRCASMMLRVLKSHL